MAIDDESRVEGCARGSHLLALHLFRSMHEGLHQRPSVAEGASTGAETREPVGGKEGSCSPPRSGNSIPVRKLFPTQADSRSSVPHNGPIKSFDRPKTFQAAARG